MFIIFNRNIETAVFFKVRNLFFIFRSRIIPFHSNGISSRLLSNFQHKKQWTLADQPVIICCSLDKYLKKRLIINDTFSLCALAIHSGCHYCYHFPFFTIFGTCNWFSAMTLTFDEAAAKVKTLKASPSNDELLKLYALFKQVLLWKITGHY